MKLVVDVKVSDLQRAVEFYSDTLGLTIRRQENDWVAISAGDAEIHLYLKGGVTRDVEFYVKDIDIVVKKFRAKSVVFLDGSRKPGAISVDENLITYFPWGRTAFFLDSEGNELAVVEDY